MSERWPKSQESGSEAINALKSEHLKEGVAPIRACIFDKEKTAERDNFPSMAAANALQVDYYASEETLNKRGIDNAGEGTYVISPNDEQDKFSCHYQDCTGVVAVGRDRESGRDISFLSHEDPTKFLRHQPVQEKFIADLRRKLVELKDRSERGSIDAVIVGGNYDARFRGFRNKYMESIELLDKILHEELGFSPVVMSGPNITNEGQAVYFDTQHRRLYILKPEELEKTNIPYIASDARQEEHKWEEVFREDNF